VKAVPFTQLCGNLSWGGSHTLKERRKQLICLLGYLAASAPIPLSTSDAKHEA
jgi:hypothetical protein